MAKNKPIVFHSDAGHGWLEVERKLLRAMHLEDKVSPYSYQRGAQVFLEEDCDAGLFVDAYKKYFGMPPYVTRMPQVDNSPIRGYKPFRPKTP